MKFEQEWFEVSGFSLVTFTTNIYGEMKFYDVTKRLI